VREGVATINALKKGMESFDDPKLLWRGSKRSIANSIKAIAPVRITTPNRVLILAEKMSKQP
jgi:hypothetical protein